jgi:hypothetical protein
VPLAPSAPYDTLATVTALARVALADFIQGIQPNNVGTVNTDATGYIVSWVSGSQFNANFNGVQIIVNGMPYTVAIVTSPTSLRLQQQAPPNQAGSAYSLVIPTGDFFADTQAYVLPTVNLAWRKLQKKLADKGHPRLESETVLSNLPIVANLDPVSECWVNWTQFFDGLNLWTPAAPPPGAQCPVLPPDFIAPLRLKERQYVSGEGVGGTINYNRMRDMHPAPNSLKGRQKGSRSRYWDWREDAIYFPGSIVPMDMWARYNAFLPDIVLAAGGFGATPVPIMRCAEALAQYAAAIFVTPRASLLGPNFEAAGDAAVDQITNAFAKLQQRASYSRRPWGSRGRRRLRTM